VYPSRRCHAGHCCTYSLKDHLRLANHMAFWYLNRPIRARSLTRCPTPRLSSGRADPSRESMHLKSVQMIYASCEEDESTDIESITSRLCASGKSHAPPALHVAAPPPNTIGRLNRFERAHEHLPRGDRLATTTSGVGVVVETAEKEGRVRMRLDGVSSSGAHFEVVYLKRSAVQERAWRIHKCSLSPFLDPFNRSIPI
jgi:hypothetical protein